MPATATSWTQMDRHPSSRQVRASWARLPRNHRAVHRAQPPAGAALVGYSQLRSLTRHIRRARWACHALPRIRTSHRAGRPPRWLVVRPRRLWHMATALQGLPPAAHASLCSRRAMAVPMYRAPRLPRRTALGVLSASHQVVQQSLAQALSSPRPHLQQSFAALLRNQFQTAGPTLPAATAQGNQHWPHRHLSRQAAATMVMGAKAPGCHPPRHQRLTLLQTGVAFPRARCSLPVRSAVLRHLPCSSMSQLHQHAQR